jgi:hypothetical protein
MKVFDENGALLVKGGWLNSGQATIPFATPLPEDSITITGQVGITTGSTIIACIYANNDDVYAQDWQPLIIKDIVAGTSFKIVLRPAAGLFSGPVLVNWSWG